MSLAYSDEDADGSWCVFKSFFWLLFLHFKPCLFT
jgi:hypothetical protein